MGCHTWFARPITNEEFHLMKNYAKVEAHELCGDLQSNKETGMVDLALESLIAKSVDEDIPCIHGSYWWELGWGSGNPELPPHFFVHISNKSIYVHVELPDILRTTHYSIKVIHNKHELRKYFRKRYFEITDEEHKILNDFWKNYSSGIMYWG